MRSHEIQFEGRVLARGFWIYVIEVLAGDRHLFYVGMTGDSSSANAASPFNRIGNHLDFRPNAKGNSLARRLQAAGVDPSESTFRMVAVGPLFDEESDFLEHKAPRDKVAAVERDLATELRARGLEVLGSQNSRRPPQPELLRDVLRELETRLPSLHAA